MRVMIIPLSDSQWQQSLTLFDPAYTIFFFDQILLKSILCSRGPSSGIDGSTSIFALWIWLRSVNHSYYIICSIQAQRSVVRDDRSTCWPQWEAWWRKPEVTMIKAGHFWNAAVQEFTQGCTFHAIIFHNQNFTDQHFVKCAFYMLFYFKEAWLRNIVHH